MIYLNVIKHKNKRKIIIIITLNMQYVSIQKRIDLILSIDKNYQHSTIVSDFNTQNPETPINLQDFKNLLRRFKKTGSVLFHREILDLVNAEKSYDQEETDKVLHVTAEQPTTSVRRSSLQSGVDFNATFGILKQGRYHPYKLAIMQELKINDNIARLQLCYFFRDKLQECPHFLQLVLFSDEATFTTNGVFNRQNFRMWATSNPHWGVGIKNQAHEKVTVWLGQMDDKLIGPFFFNGNVTAESYLEMLQNQLLPELQVLGVPLYFQQDGAPAHFALVVRQYLNTIFPNRYISRGGPVNWPPRSPDLTPLDFSIWGILKDEVYREPINSLDHLKARIIEEVNKITPETLLKTLKNLTKRINLCIAQNGNLFEHLLN